MHKDHLAGGPLSLCVGFFSGSSQVCCITRYRNILNSASHSRCDPSVDNTNAMTVQMGLLLLAQRLV